tara:strand:- start:113 stop:1096 length:984 start_codon:yes stop_codon:yes gene_type:complete
MKNRPITARVKSGMFKTREPLLNVGPAGVDGNNKTRTMPSPSKMKGYSMKSSPFKQEVNAADKALEKANLTFDGKGGAGGQKESTTIIPGDVKQGKEITRTKDFDTNWDESKYGPYDEWIKKPGNKAKSDAFIATQQEPTGTFEPDIVGPDKVVKTKVKGDIYRKSEGDAQSAYNRRENIRASKVTGRQKKRQTIKQGRLTDKLAGIDKEKNPGKYRRVKAKLQQATDRLGVATSETENVANQSKQNIKAGSTKNTRGADVKNTAADWDKDTQIKNLDSDTPKTPPAKNPVSNINTSPNTEIGFTKKKVGLNMFAKKSPLKMNYFKK